MRPEPCLHLCVPFLLAAPSAAAAVIWPCCWPGGLKMHSLTPSGRQQQAWQACHSSCRRVVWRTAQSGSCRCVRVLLFVCYAMLWCGVMCVSTTAQQQTHELFCCQTHWHMCILQYKWHVHSFAALTHTYSSLSLLRPSANNQLNHFLTLCAPQQHGT